MLGASAGNKEYLAAVNSLVLLKMLVPCAAMLLLGWMLGRGGRPDDPKEAYYAAWLLPVEDSAVRAQKEKIKERRLWQQEDTIYRDDDLVLTQNGKGYVNVFRYFRPEKTFEDYPVKEIYRGPLPAKLNFSTCTWGKMYKTMTQYGFEQGVAFAGHYAFAAWGCGSNCQSCSVIDLHTGNVYAGPDAMNGYQFRIDSRVLVVNRPDSNGLYGNCAYCTPEQYLWTGTSFVRLE